MLRLFRALRSVSGFTITVFSFAQVVPLMARYFAVLFCILFSYAVLGECTCARVLVRCVHARSAVPSHAHALTMTACVCGCGALAGMELFAGKLVASNPMVAASSYGTNDYYVNNFDTLVRAGGLLRSRERVRAVPTCASAHSTCLRRGRCLWMGLCSSAKLGGRVVRAAGGEQLAHRDGGMRRGHHPVGTHLLPHLLRLLRRRGAQRAGTSPPPSCTRCTWPARPCHRW